MISTLFNTIYFYSLLAYIDGASTFPLTYELIKAYKLTDKCGSSYDLGEQLEIGDVDLQDIKRRFTRYDDLGRLSVLHKFLSLYENKRNGMERKLAVLAVVLKRLNCDDNYLSVGNLPLFFIQNICDLSN